MIDNLSIGVNSQYWYINGFVWRGKRSRALSEYTEFDI